MQLQLGDPNIRHSSHNLSLSNTLEFFKKPASYLPLNDTSLVPAPKRVSSPKTFVAKQNDETAVCKKGVAGDIISAVAAFSRTPMERWLLENRHQDDAITNEKRSV